MSEEIDEEWHGVLSERNGLRGALEVLTDVLRQYHDDHHTGPSRWCDAPPCRLLFRQNAQGQPSQVAWLKRRSYPS